MVSGAHTIDDLEVEKSLKPAPFEWRVIGAPFYIPPAHSGCPAATYLIRMNAEKRLVKGASIRISLPSSIATTLDDALDHLNRGRA
jgi:hypothetical protein